MKQFEEWERAGLRNDRNVQECTECKSTWFEVADVCQIDADQICTLGQQPLQLNIYKMLKCIKCNELNEPPVTATHMLPSRDRQAYEAFIKELVENYKSRKGLKDKEESDEVQE